MNKIQITTGVMALGLLLGLASSCKKDKQVTPPVAEPLADYYEAGTQSLSNGKTVQLYFRQEPFAGYNDVAVRVNGEGNNAESVEFYPIMNMGTMIHATPFDNPEYQAELKAFGGTTTFIMPAESPLQWNFGVIVKQSNLPADTVYFDLQVKSTYPPMIYSFGSNHNSTNYFVALVEPEEAQVGINNLTLAVYYRENQMSFPPATDLSLVTTPWMPSMGHGSSDNENPLHREKGLYSGKVNFNMAGNWDVYIDVKDSLGNVHDDAGYFPFVVQ